MWIFAKKGFLSVVKDRYGEGLLIRSRWRADLEALFPDVEIEEMPRADYRFRIRVTRLHLANVLCHEVLELDYPNFKAEIRDRERHDRYLEVWSALRRQRPQMTYPDEIELGEGEEPTGIDEALREVEAWSEIETDLEVEAEVAGKLTLAGVARVLGVNKSTAWRWGERGMGALGMRPASVVGWMRANAEFYPTIQAAFRARA